MHHIQSGNFQDILKQYMRSRVPKRFQLRTLVTQPTRFITDSQLMQQLDGPQKWQHVASGGFGSIFLCQWLGTDVVVKWTTTATTEDDEDDDEDDGAEQFATLEESVLASSMSHPHIVQFFVASTSAIVMERMVNGSLSSMIRTRPMPDFATRIRWCRELASAVLYIHEFDVIHGDISIGNTMFTAHDSLKLGDFGAAWFNSTATSNKITTDQYLPLALLSPQADLDAEIGQTTDLYAMVCVMINIIFWHADIFELCGLPFFEREFNRAADKDAFLTESIGVACRTIWSKLQAIDDLTIDVKQILYTAFVRPVHHMCDKDTQQDIQTVLGCVGTWIGTECISRSLIMSLAAEHQ